MSHNMDRLRPILKDILKRLGLLPAARRFWRGVRFLIEPGFRRRELRHRRRERAGWQRFLQFRQQYGDVLGACLSSVGNSQKKALVISAGEFPLVQLELALVKALQLAGFEPALLIVYGEQTWHLPEYYSLTGVEEIHSWSEFCESPDLGAASAALDGVRSVGELVSLEHAGARVGRSAYATALRELREGSLNLQSNRGHRTLVKFLASAMASANAAQKALLDIRPDLLLLLDSMYTPEGELVDSCVEAGIDVIMYGQAHRSNSLMLKRYTLGNRDEHPASLSQTSWRLVRDMPWTDAHREQLQRELYSCYASGEWCSVWGTQFAPSFISAGELRKRLGLDLAKKTAFIFPHILWDASAIWGEDLFNDYEEWLVETVRAACANDQLNWVIKIHPAHVYKSMVEGYRGEPAEVCVLRKHIGELPSHVFMIPADSDICTFSLFELMDYCLTVRGTVGIEAASFGIPVLTAGTGRYDHMGFTIDSESGEQYLERVAHIQDIPRLSIDLRELAERFAYGLFLLRPLPLTTVTFKYHKDCGVEKRLTEAQINIRTKGGWYTGSDLGAFAHWVTDPSQLDFLMPLLEERDVLLP